MSEFTQKPKAAKKATPAKPAMGSRTQSAPSVGSGFVSSLQEQEASSPVETVSNRSAIAYGLDFSQVPVNASPSSYIQPKLNGDALTDSSEQEADRIAEHVIRQQPREGEVHEVGIRATASRGPVRIDSETTEGLTKRLKSDLGGGNPLSNELHAYFQPRMGHDFSQVRIHTGHGASEMNRHLGARAFTHGQNIYFRHGAFDPRSTEGKRLLAHELTHTIQQARSTATIQREADDRTDAVMQELERMRPTSSAVAARFGTTERALRTFRARIPDLEDFVDVAESYGMRPGNLFAVFVLEGAFGNQAYWQPVNLETCPGTQATLTDSASLAACHLWQSHGMDDYAVTKRVPCRSGDNVFDVHSGGHRSAMLSSLGELYAQGMLWGSNGLRASDPRQQLTPGEIVSQLTQHVNLSTQLPDDGFIRFAYRIQAATVASRQQLIGRNRLELTRLGYDPDVVASFGHGAIERERVRVAAAQGLFPRSVDTPQERVAWTYGHLSDPRFGRALMEDERYRALVRRSYQLRMPPEAARITMGRPEAAREAVEEASADFRVWERRRAGRRAVHRWALDANVSMIILQGGQIDASREDELLHQIDVSINEDNFPNRAVRRDVQRVMREWIRARDYDNMRALIRFVVDAGSRYSHIEDTGLWIQALSEPREDPSNIPQSLINYLTPTSVHFSGGIRNILGIYGQAVRYAQGLVEAREELD